MSVVLAFVVGIRKSCLPKPFKRMPPAVCPDLLIGFKSILYVVRDNQPPPLEVLSVDDFGPTRLSR